MAESKGTMLAKSMQKHAGRAKEKILQNLGKVDRTADEIFDDHLNNFTRQQGSANRLQKEFNNYIRCIRAAQTASKSLMDAISEIYEPQWTGYDALQAQTAASESLWQDFAHKLGDQVLIPLNTYTGQFPEMKKKVEKRNRKLIDYDSQRHSFQSLQASANKRKDDVKLTKGREQLEEARRTYEILNTELHDELPALYDSRILFLVTNLQTLFATEQVFHNETSKIYSELEAIVDKLATDSQRGSNTLRKPTLNAIKASSPVQSPVKQLNHTINNTQNNYQNQNQITTNGSSNVNNSPTSSPSTSSPPPLPPPHQQQQQPRLDSVSSTPESMTENRKSTTPTPTLSSPDKAATSVATSAATTAASAMSHQNNAESVLATNTTTASAATPTTPTTKTSSSVAEQQQPPLPHPLSLNNSNAVANTDTITSTTNTTTTTPTKPTNSIANDKEMLKSVAPSGTTTKAAKAKPSLPNIEQQQQQLNGNGNGNANVEDDKKSLGNETLNGNRKQLVNKNPFEEDEEIIYDVPKDATTADLPPGVLYRVKATYGYVKEDVDELSFEIGEVIRVIEYDDPDDQEEGWLMGQKEGTDEKGLFPANFTRPI